MHEQVARCPTTRANCTAASEAQRLAGGNTGWHFNSERDFFNFATLATTRGTG
jgi:hypothetical protein